MIPSTSIGGVGLSGPPPAIAQTPAQLVFSLPQPVVYVFTAGTQVLLNSSVATE